MINGIPKEAHIIILTQCSMCTKKWTYAKKKEYEKARRIYIKEHIDNKCLLIKE